MSWDHSNGTPFPLPEPVYYRVDGRAERPWEEARTYRCRCGQEMQPRMARGIELAAFWCPACDRLLALNYERQTFAWYAPEQA